MPAQCFEHKQCGPLHPLLELGFRKDTMAMYEPQLCLTVLFALSRKHIKAAPPWCLLLEPDRLPNLRDRPHSSRPVMSPGIQSIEPFASKSNWASRAQGAFQNSLCHIGHKSIRHDYSGPVARCLMVKRHN